MKTPPQFLVTAGNTREAIDEVRDWGNIFTGQTGRDIAVALAALGDVLLLTSNAQHVRELRDFQGGGGRIITRPFRCHADLLAELEQAMQQPPDAVLMTAAVADYAPVGAFRVVSVENILGTTQQRWIVEDVRAPKIKSTHGQIAILGEPTLKLIDQFRGPWGYKGMLVKFKLEVGISEDQLLAIARESRAASGADLIVANTLEMVRGPAPGAYIVGEQLTERIGRAELAGRLREHVGAYLAGRR
jgi:phosphopantothenate---cysteine ligase (CTP)